MCDPLSLFPPHILTNVSIPVGKDEVLRELQERMTLFTEREQNKDHEIEELRAEVCIHVN